MMRAKGSTTVDVITVIGSALSLLPLLTVWHEIGGHAATCVLLGGKLTEVGAFYVRCDGLSDGSARIVACAGSVVDALLALGAWSLLIRVTMRDLIRLLLFYVFVSKAFAASGYLIFSGVTALGDFGVQPDAALYGTDHQILWRVSFVIVGSLFYYLAYAAASRHLLGMLGTSATGRKARRRIAHVYYIVAGLDALIVGVINPIGLRMTLTSAAASTFGAGVGFISLGIAGPPSSDDASFQVRRHWLLLVVGIGLSASFAAVLGGSLRLRN